MKMIALSLCAVAAIALLTPGQAKAEHRGGVVVEVDYSYGRPSHGYSGGYARPGYHCPPPVACQPPVYYCPPPRPVCRPVYTPAYRCDTPQYYGRTYDHGRSYGHGGYGDRGGYGRYDRGR